MRDRSTRRLTLTEAQHALYIDFEGRKDKPPVLLGATHSASADRVHQYVTDPHFASIADDDALEVLPLEAAIERIIQRAEKRDRLIVSWTEHELHVVRDYAPALLDRFGRRFRNALTLAKYWRNKCHGSEKPSHGALVNYLDLVGYQVPEAAGVGRAADTIRILGDAFDRGRTAAQLTANQRQRWSDLRNHNAHDCAGMRSICMTAVSALSSSSIPTPTRLAPVASLAR
jgi:hypothetical protein